MCPRYPLPSALHATNKHDAPNIGGQPRDSRSKGHRAKGSGKVTIVVSSGQGRERLDEGIGPD